MKSAEPHATAGSSSWARTVSPPVVLLVHSDEPRTNAMRSPAGESLASYTPAATSGTDTSPVRRSTNTICPPSTVTAFVTSASHEYVTTPEAPSRARSRRRFSSSVRSPVKGIERGSRTSRSCAESTSRTHSMLTGSLPPAERAKTTRCPSGETVKLRGSPRVNRWVRACWRGNVSVMPGAARRQRRGRPWCRRTRVRTSRDRVMRLSSRPRRDVRRPAGTRR